ncbi:uncharacterized protein BO97DRAFT_16646 [Aspergillus homomorphus CBS 101889]|uniref:Uncharacterized protein n=1 Tax=Aspergillus homomorphus (strain CBS 101889) TaxID=1450537 RepID=A0A395I2N0_ASPHC|nr:hypothetical protein BO97DRAFT_16646 [Aspergillus homomorphus CBS 101889]RAL13985.1 hypothetical protein BO97DRAFT_16646 [Aspergillus homomorphus CBS 101889]
MTTTSPNPPWVLKKKAVLVSTPDVEVSCFARLRIAHDQIANQGSISLRITADLANSSGRSQVLTLNVPPELVEECALARISNDTLCSSRLVSLLRASVTSVSAVSTLSLRLGATGVVLCPSGMESLSPANPGDANFNAFAKICQSKSLRLHFSRRQFVNDELTRLDAFALALQKRSLRAESLDHARHGVVSRDWRVFNLSLDPPPYCEEPMSEPVQQVDPPRYCEETKSEPAVGKRRRDQGSLPPDEERRKRLLLASPEPLGSPTEVNTPSTLSPSPSTASIRPTKFTHTPCPSRTERTILARLEHELSGISDELIRKVLIRTGRQHLLAHPDKVAASNPTKANPNLLDPNLKEYIDALLTHRLKSHLMDTLIDTAVTECRDQVADEHKTNTTELRDQLDESNADVRNTANECIKEMKEQAQKHMQEIEDQAQQCMHDIETQRIEVEMAAEKNVARFRRWVDNAASARSGNAGIARRRSF